MYNKMLRVLDAQCMINPPICCVDFTLLSVQTVSVNHWVNIIHDHLSSLVIHFGVSPYKTGWDHIKSLKRSNILQINELYIVWIVFANFKVI